MKICISLSATAVGVASRVVVRLADNEWFTGKVTSIGSSVGVLLDDGRRVAVPARPAKHIKLLSQAVPANPDLLGNLEAAFLALENPPGQEPLPVEVEAKPIAARETNFLDSAELLELEDGLFLWRGRHLSPKQRAAYRLERDYIETLRLVLPIARALGAAQAIKSFWAVGQYTTTFYGRMNTSLRAGKLPKGTADIDAYIRHVVPITANVVYRGVGKEFFSTLEVGNTYTDAAFVSVTSSKDIATYFSKKGRKGGVLEISGVKSVAVPAAACNPDEREYLLPRGSSFKVISIEGSSVKIKFIRNRSK